MRKEMKKIEVTNIFFGIDTYKKKLFSGQPSGKATMKKAVSGTRSKRP